jgi:hypothetical protein
MLMFELARQVFEQVPRTLGVTRRIRLNHRAADPGAPPLGQSVGDIAFFALAAARNQCAAAEDLGHRLRSALAPSITTCGFSKLNPHEFIGGFERQAITCVHGRCRQAEQSRSPEANLEPALRCCWKRSRCAIKLPCWSAAELVARVSGVLIGCFATVSRYLPAPSRGQHRRGGPFFAIKPVRSASIPRSGRGFTRACMVSPIGPSAWDPRLRRLLR